MDYEKAYKEAFERAKQVHASNVDENKKSAEYIFPQLKESEGERVRKELIDAVQSLWDDDALPMPLTTRRRDEWLAWLKKQGKKVDVIEGFDTEFEKQVSHLLASVLSGEDEYTEGLVKWASNSLLGYAKHEIEKQGEHKSAWSEEDEKNLQGVIDEIEANKNNAPDYDLATYDRFLSWLKSLRPQNTEKPQGKSALEAIDEKPVDNANKVGPKFHKGEWITNGYLCCQISDVLDDRYIVNTKFEKRSAIPFKPENGWHLWTIQDAKDGDVLVHNDCVFIFMGLKDGIVQAINEFFSKPTNFGDPDIDDDYHPATKEQRDLLEKAMADAGYTFDFEKKELKKIATSKSEAGDKIEPRFKVGDWVVANYSRKISQVVAVSEDGYGYQLNDGLCFGVSWCDIFHLWNIKNDANDGDVLQLGKVTVIFKELIGNEHCKCYCSICNGKLEIPSQDGADNDYGCCNAAPATKEQWGALRSKMKEAGYEWDSEKKELKEIVAPKSEAGDGEEDDKEGDDKTENWKLTLARQRLGNEARTWKTPKVRKYE